MKIAVVPIPFDLTEYEDQFELVRSTLARWRKPHPSLLPTYGIEQTSEGWVLLTAPEPPTTVREVMAVLANGEVLSASERTSWAVARVLELIGAVTSVGEVHGDITPEALGFDVAGHAVLMPPIARLASRQTRTGMGVVRRSLDALSPEAIRGTKCGPQSDVYQLGYLLYRLLGGPRVAGESDLAVLQTIMSGVVLPRLRTIDVEVPPLLDEIVAHATAHAPDQRFASPKDLGGALGPFGVESASARVAVAEAVDRARWTRRSESESDSDPDLEWVHGQRELGRRSKLFKMFDSPVRVPCPKRWDELTPTADPAVRDCSQCRVAVQRVHTLEALVPLAGSCVLYDPKRET